MAGEESFAQPLNGDEVGPSPAEVRLAPAPSGGVAVDLERQRWLTGARMPGVQALRVAALLDDATEACLAPECDLDTGFGAVDWRERLEAHPPHLLLVESAEAGNGGGWTGAIAPHPGSPQAGLPALRELLAWCREREVPSAFWATRDPLGFERFAEAASLCDHIFTVDAERVPAYGRLPGVAPGSVFTLPLAAQPRLHNPIGADERRPEPALVEAADSSWPVERRRQLAALRDAAERFGLVAYEGLSPSQAADSYRRHRVFLSASPTASSPSAVSREIFELLACGTPVLSTPSSGIEELLGDLVPMADGVGEAAERLEWLLGDDAHRRELATRARRHVLGAHTYRDRLAELVTAVGFVLPANAGEEAAVLVAAGTAVEVGEAVDSLIDQSLAPDEILFGLERGVAVEGDLDRLRERFPGARIRTLYQDGNAEQSERLRELARLAAAPWAVPIAPTLRYGPHHLRDLLGCTRFADADVIGLAGGESESHRYAVSVRPYAALATRALVAERGWPRDEAELRRWFEAGVRSYAGETER